MLALPRVLGVVIGIAGIGFAASGVYSAWRGYDYTMNNAEFCRGCHTMGDAWTRWQGSEHRNVTCHACHQASIVDSAKQVITFVLRQPQRVGTHAVVPKEVCQRCHFSGDPQWRQVAATAGHRVHVEQRAIQCVVCHAPAIHRFKPATEICGTCHVAQTTGERRVVIKAMADMHCTQCHEYLRPQTSLGPARQTCLQCHQALPGGATRWPAGAPHAQLACGQCHKPHERSQPIVSCRTCHEKPRPDMHPQTVLQATACTVCHKPHSWKVGQ